MVAVIRHALPPQECVEQVEQSGIEEGTGTEFTERYDVWPAGHVEGIHIRKEIVQEKQNDAQRAGEGSGQEKTEPVAMTDITLMYERRGGRHGEQQISARDHRP